jgi:hypothetical protein
LFQPLFQELVLLAQFLQFGGVRLAEEFLLQAMDRGKVTGGVRDTGGEWKRVVDL